MLRYTQARATNYYLPSMHTPHFLDISIQWLPYFLLCSFSAPKNVVQLLSVQMIKFSLANSALQFSHSMSLTPTTIGSNQEKYPQCGDKHSQTRYTIDPQRGDKHSQTR